MKDNPSLDLLRAMAVGLVLANHLATTFFGFGLSGAAAYVLFDELGQLGVGLFFVHTCLVLMLSLERSGEGFAAFMLRRVFRIYPLSVAAVLLYAALGHPLLASNILLVQNVTGDPSYPYPLWSLPYEVQMYLVLPVLFSLALRARSVLMIWVGALVVALLAEGAGEGAYRMVQYVPCFLPGVLAFALRRTLPRLSACVLFCFVLAVVLLLPRIVSAGVPRTQALWLVCLAVGWVIPHCSPLRSILLARVASLIAKYSYGIYLLHPIAILLVIRAMPQQTLLVKFLAFCVLLAASSFAAYRLIEAPGIALGKRLADRLHARGFALRGLLRSTPQPPAR